MVIKGEEMKQRLKIILTALLACTAIGAVSAETFNGGIPLKETEALAKQIIPLPKGDPKPLLALAMRHGEAHGQFTGKAAAAMKKKFGRDIPIFIDAVKTVTPKGKSDCGVVRLTFRSDDKNAAAVPPESVAIEVCPNRGKP